MFINSQQVLQPPCLLLKNLSCSLFFVIFLLVLFVNSYSLKGFDPWSHLKIYAITLILNSSINKRYLLGVFGNLQLVIYLFIYFCVDIFFSFFLKSSLFIFYLIEKKSSDSNKKRKKNFTTCLLRQHFVDAKDVIWVFSINKILTQKMLYKFLASTKCWR